MQYFLNCLISLFKNCLNVLNITTTCPTLPHNWKNLFWHLQTAGKTSVSSEYSIGVVRSLSKSNCVSPSRSLKYTCGGFLLFRRSILNQEWSALQNLSIPSSVQNIRISIELVLIDMFAFVHRNKSWCILSQGIYSWFSIPGPKCGLGPAGLVHILAQEWRVTRAFPYTESWHHTYYIIKCKTGIWQCVAIPMRCWLHTFSSW